MGGRRDRGRAGHVRVCSRRVRDQRFEQVVIENLSHFRVLETLRDVQEDFIIVLTECMAGARMPGTPAEHRETARFLYQAAFSLTLWIGYFDGPNADPDQQKRNLKRLLMGYLRA